MKRLDVALTLCPKKRNNPSKFDDRTVYGVAGTVEALGLWMTLLAEALLIMNHIQLRFFFKEPGSISRVSLELLERHLFLLCEQDFLLLKP